MNMEVHNQVHQDQKDSIIFKTIDSVQMMGAVLKTDNEAKFRNLYQRGFPTSELNSVI